MKRRFVLFILLLSLLTISAAGTVREDLFSSSDELEAFGKKAVTEDESTFYDEMNIYLLTGGEGSLIWENFGHSAFVVEVPSLYSVAFDYGIFTFDETFIPNFIFGKLYYEVWESYSFYRIESLKEEDRNVTLLPLSLTPDEKKTMYTFLLYNTEEENRTYLYDYFNDNCATRLRDIYSYVTDGDFEVWLKSRESSTTIRESVNRYLSRSTFPVSWVINYLLGPSVDKSITRWEECYLPMNLEKAVNEYQESTSIEVYSSKTRAGTPSSYPFLLYSFLFGILLGLVSLLSSFSRHHKAGDLILGIVYTVFGIMSLLLLFFELFTIHYVTHGNLNIFLISPLCLYVGILHFKSLSKKGRKEKKIQYTGIAMLSLSLLTVIIRLTFSSLLIQNIWAPAATAVILYTAEALPILKRRIKP